MRSMLHAGNSVAAATVRAVETEPITERPRGPARTWEGVGSGGPAGAPGVVAQSTQVFLHVPSPLRRGLAAAPRILSLAAAEQEPSSRARTERSPGGATTRRTVTPC